MRIAVGLFLIIAGLVLVGTGSLSGEFGDRDVVSLMAGAAAIFLGIGFVIRGAMRTAIWILAAVLFVTAGGFALIRNVF